MPEYHLVVRTAKLSNIEHIVALSREWGHEGSTIGEEAYNAEYYLEKLNGLCLVALDNQVHYIGFLTATRTKPNYAINRKDTGVLEIEELYVRPSHRSSGVGSELLSHAQRFALENGIRYLHVFTASRDLERVLSFYQAHGFNPWGFQAYIDLDSSNPDNIGNVN
jgi:GNAT superfamily N-acetyltransferase